MALIRYQTLKYGGGLWKFTDRSVTPSKSFLAHSFHDTLSAENTSPAFTPYAQEKGGRQMCDESRCHFMRERRMRAY